MLPSTANINSAVLTVLKVGGSSTKAVLTADKKFNAFRPKMESNLTRMMFQKDLLRMMMNSSQGVHNVGRTLMRRKTGKFVAYAAAILSTKDVRCFRQDTGSVSTVWKILMKRDGKCTR